MSRWTTEQVIALAPDARAVKAARGLARPGPWSELGSTSALVWGKCQGSGATPYQVSVDLTEPAFRCSCPSRKLPCKHGLALLLLWVEGDGSVADVGDAADAPGFAAEWASQRAARATGGRGGSEKAGARAAGSGEAGAPVDPEAQARRLQQRLSLMTAGLEDFERWLGDLVRQGLAAARHQPYAFWDQTAARLVDAQVPGLGERVREMGSSVHRRSDWAEHLLAETGRWFLAVRAWAGRDQLDPAAQGDLRVVLGWPMSTDVVLQGDTIRDRWQVMGLHRTDDGRLQEQRTWLRGVERGRWALILDFAAAGGTLRVPQVTGSIVDAELALYPGSEPRRAVFVGEPVVTGRADQLVGRSSLTQALGPLSATIAANPFAMRVPLSLSSMTVTTLDERRFAVDEAGATVPLVADHDPWPLLACTGGHPVELFGEWEHGELRPLTVVVDRTLVPV